jgi:hypothetical protein
MILHEAAMKSWLFNPLISPTIIVVRRHFLSGDHFVRRPLLFGAHFGSATTFVQRRFCPATFLFDCHYRLANIFVRRLCLLSDDFCPATCPAYLLSSATNFVRRPFVPGDHLSTVAIFVRRPFFPK